MITQTSLEAAADSSEIYPESTSANVLDIGIGLSNPQLSQGRRQMLDLVNRLHSTGVQTDVDLPQIAVIGSQSAGKSSLIESISGITLPRAAGTCTRCPTECSLSYSPNPWKCDVSVRFLTDENGQPSGKARNVPFGPTILDKANVQDRIRRAQRAALNPSIDHSKFLEDDGKDDEYSCKSQLTFTTNCVSLKISGKDVADLSFCDLPGLIRTAGQGGNAGDVELIENLVSSYVKKPSCLILLTIACETDFQNQGAHELAKRHDPEGKRTIGVLTKPDRIPPGEEDMWLRFIRNEYEPLENNWYCVKQPDTQQLAEGITWQGARAKENEYFSMKQPWSDLDSSYQQLLRTSNLTERLSHILSDLISKRLPEIQDEVQDLLRKTENSLNQLPKAPSGDSFGEIMQLLGSFTRNLSRSIAGTPEADGLLQTIRPVQHKFRAAIRKTAPDFRPYERKEAATRSLPKADFLLNEDEPGAAHGSIEVPAKGYGAKAQNKLAWSTSPIYIDEVIDRARKAQTRELPNNYPFVVQECFIAEVTKKWPGPAKELFDATRRIIESHVRNMVTEHFASFGQGGLEQRVKVILSEHIKKQCERALAHVEWLLTLESAPFTLNTHYLSDYRDKFVAYYKGNRHYNDEEPLIDHIETHRANPNGVREGKHAAQTSISRVLSGLAEVGISGVNPRDLVKLLPSDPFDPALYIMADVRAYFQVAYKRITDNIPLAIDHELVRGIERNIAQTLYAGLGINGPGGYEACAALVAENPSVASRRKELQKRWERLNTASQELCNLTL